MRKTAEQKKADKRAYYLKNREKMIAKVKKYYSENKELIKDRRKEYVEEHREERAAYAKEWRKQNPGYTRAYYEENVEFKREYGREYAKAHVEERREYRVNNRDAFNQNKVHWKEKHPERPAAHMLVRNALRRGEIVRLPCEICGCEPSEAHHDDYNKPLEISWLCRSHHKEADHQRRIKEGDTKIRVHRRSSKTQQSNTTN